MRNVFSQDRSFFPCEEKLRLGAEAPSAASPSVRWLTVRAARLADTSCSNTFRIWCYSYTCLNPRSEPAS